MINNKISFAVIGVLVAGMLVFTAITQTPRAQDTVAPDKEQIQSIVREYLLTNPEVIIEAMEAYRINQAEIESRKFGEKISEYKESLYNDSKTPFAGNPDGSIVIVEFYDYNCGYCKKAVEDVQEIIENNDDVKVIFKDMPILSAASRVAAQWSIAAAMQDMDKYFDFHLALMKHPGAKDVAALSDIAEKSGLDVEKLKKDAQSKDVQAEIEKNLLMSRDLGINGTPAFIINDNLSPGYLGYDRMKQMVDSARDNQG